MLDQQNLEMYSEAHGTYDLTNHILSLFTDSAIRKKAAEELLGLNPKKVLDAATGTGDMAISIARLAGRADIDITGIDVNEDMLKEARLKAERSKAVNIRFEAGDATALRYTDSCFDAVSCSFSTKNFDVDRFAGEAYRVLKKGGRLFITDVSMPERGFGRTAFRLYYIYMRFIGALAGKKLYRWLPDSTMNFRRADLLMSLKEKGFADMHIDEFLFGIAYIISCAK